MSKMKIQLTGGDFATQVTEWEVPEQMVRGYATFWAGWIAKGLVESAIALHGAESEDQANGKMGEMLNKVNAN
jgi:hypothetical protein